MSPEVEISNGASNNVLSMGVRNYITENCYGYKHNYNGKLQIDEREAANVKVIFKLYLKGKSIVGYYQ